MSKTKIDPENEEIIIQDAQRFGDLQKVMSGIDPDVETGLANYGFFLKDRRLWIIEDSKIIQGKNEYTMYLPGDMFSLVLQEGSEKGTVCVNYLVNNISRYKSSDIKDINWDPCGFCALLGGKASSLGACAWLVGKDNAASVNQPIEWRSDLKINTEVKLDGSDNSYTISISKKAVANPSLKCSIMTESCPVVADLNDIHGIKFRIEDIHYGQPVQVMTGLSCKENVRDLTFPKFVLRRDNVGLNDVKPDVKKKGCICNIL